MLGDKRQSDLHLPSLDLRSLSAAGVNPNISGLTAALVVDGEENVNPLEVAEDDINYHGHSLDEEQQLLLENAKLREQMRLLNQNINDILDGKEP